MHKDPAISVLLEPIIQSRGLIVPESERNAVIHYQYEHTP